VFWAIGNFLFCDDCFRNGRYQADLAGKAIPKSEKRIVFSPIQAQDGTWMTSDGIEFGDLKQIIDDCILLKYPNAFLPNKISISKDAILSLLDFAESLIQDPFQEPQFQSLVIENETSKEVISRCSSRKMELQKELIELEPTRKASQKTERIRPNELYPPTEIKCRKIERRIYKLEKRIREEQKRTLEIQKMFDDMLKYHPSRFPKEDLTSFRNALSCRCSYPPLISCQTDNLQNGSGQQPEPQTIQVDFELPVKSVSWELLEPQHTQLEDLIRHYSKQSKTGIEEYDIERLKFVYHFNPSEIYVGKAAFEGYVVFCFKAKGRAVLECPKSGNAIYLMKIVDWKKLSQLSKTELLHSYRRDVSRILHSDKWQYELELWIEHGGIPLLEPLNID